MRKHKNLTFSAPFQKCSVVWLKGDKATLESLMLENENAEILWAGEYPEDVAEKLNEISSSQPLKKIPVSEDGNKVKIIASGWPFPIEMKLINREWRINADNIIALRMMNK